MVTHSGIVLDLITITQYSFCSVSKPQRYYITMKTLCSHSAYQNQLKFTILTKKYMLSTLVSTNCDSYLVLKVIARWLETSFPKFNRHEYYTAVSYIIRLGNVLLSKGNVRIFKIIWSSKENMVQFFRNQGQRSKNIFHTKIHWIPNFN